MLKHNPYVERKPLSGRSYKLWSLPIGSIVIRHGLQIKGTEVGPFKIIEHAGAHTICKTQWDFEFDLDSSFTVEFISKSYVNQFQ